MAESKQIEPPTTNPGIDTKAQVITLTRAATSNATINRRQLGAWVRKGYEADGSRVVSSWDR